MEVVYSVAWVLGQAAICFLLGALAAGTVLKRQLDKAQRNEMMAREEALVCRRQYENIERMVVDPEMRAGVLRILASWPAPPSIIQAARFARQMPHSGSGTFPAIVREP